MLAKISAPTLFFIITLFIWDRCTCIVCQIYKQGTRVLHFIKDVTLHVASRYIGKKFLIRQKERTATPAWFCLLFVRMYRFCYRNNDEGFKIGVVDLELEPALMIIIKTVFTVVNLKIEVYLRQLFSFLVVAPFRNCSD